MNGRVARGGADGGWAPATARVFAVMVTTLVAGLACARTGAIPGGPEDRVPPVVIETAPTPDTTVGAWNDPVRIRFSERISERGLGGSLEDAVIVSPQLEEVRVKHVRDGLEVSSPGGFPEGQVYRITVLPEIADMFGNRLPEPFEFLFSTGPDISQGAIAGLVTDRITGQPARVRVEAQAEDSTIHHTRSDEDGLFALRALPQGRYALRAFEDRNRNNEPDFQEPQGGQSLLLPTSADTLVFAVTVLAPDTTAATLVRLEAVDSLAIRMEFDDFMDPEAALGLVAVRLARETGESPVVERVLHPHEFEALRTAQAEQRAREEREAAAARADADTAGTDTVVADTAGVDPRLVRPPIQAAPPGLAGREPGPQPPEEDPGPPLPAQALYAVLDSPMLARAPYETTITGITNINGLPLGGGTATVVWEPPEPDSLSVPDSAVVTDTTQLVDTMQTVDTTQVPDTGQVIDTGQIIDTIQVVDTTRTVDTTLFARRRPW